MLDERSILKNTIWYDFHFMQSPKIFHKVSLTIKLK